MGLRTILDQSNLKMAHKGVVLVSIPLILGIFFVSVLGVLLIQTEREAQREAHSRTVMTLANGLASSLMDGIFTVSAYLLTKSDSLAQRYDQIANKFPEQYQSLRAELRGEPEKLKTVAHLELLTQRAFTLLTVMRNSQEYASNPKHVIYIAGLRPHVTSLLKEFLTEQHQLIDSVQIDATATPLSSAVTRMHLHQAFVFGMVLNIIMSLLLALYFSRAITSRINVLVDNAFRLVRKEPLHPRLAGTDEIAHLDTVLHEMATTLEEAAARERAIISNAADVICSINEELKFTAVSPAAIKLWGYTPEELIGDRLTKYLHEEDVPSTLNATKQLALTQDSLSFENRFQKKDGEVTNMLWSAYWSQNDRTFFCVAHDITERKEAEELVKQSEARVRLILESMPVGLTIINEDGFIETINARMEGMLGFSAQDLSGKHLTTLFPKQSEGDQAAFMKQLLQKAFGRSTELLARCANDETMPVELSISKLQMREGPRLLTTMQDVTERHEIEQLKQDFVAMVSHDVKTPLASILSTLGLVAANAFGGISDRGKQIIHASERQVTRLINMLNDLLLIERIEAGGFELHLADTDLRDVLHESVESVKQAASQNSVTISTTDTDAHVHADGTRLVQVMVNLLSNAIKFSSPQSVVTVSIDEQPEWIEVRVSDQGRGIPETHKKMIFEKFKQVKISDSKDKGGTGLGLPICKLIVDKHGGQIGVESEEDKGSTFWFRIPRESKSAAARLTKTG